VQITAITAYDAAATPVNHTFDALKVDGDLATWAERTADTAIGFWPLKISLRAPQVTSSESVYRAKLSFAMPVTVDETVNGVTRTKVERTFRANLDVIIPALAVEQERKDFIELLSNILDDSTVRTVFEDVENIYG
jgi:hypothetical protein